MLSSLMTPAVLITFTLLVTAAALALTTPVWAQSRPEVNDGTNPTLLATRAGIQYKYSDFETVFSNALFEASYSAPLGPGKNKPLNFNHPYTARLLLRWADGQAAIE